VPTPIISLLRDKSAPEVLSALGGLVSQAPFITMKDHLPSIPEELRVVMLIMDFEAEVAINGVFGFLENTSGLHLAETAEAFRLIHAPHAAQTLENIRDILHAFGMSPQKLRDNFAGVEQYQIISSTELHGAGISAMVDRIEEEARRNLYIFGSEGEPVYDLLVAFVTSRQAQILAWAQQYDIP
jgi:Domain of unknown function (DUF4375)